jgi:hypothetical protein
MESASLSVFFLVTLRQTPPEDAYFILTLRNNDRCFGARMGTRITIDVARSVVN